MKHEIFQDNGKEVIFYIIEILQYIFWEEAYTSLYTASTAKSKNSDQLILEQNTSNIEFNLKIFTLNKAY